MAQGKNKPDLSDLKARLGLKKPGAAKTDEPSDDAEAPAQQAGGQTPADGPGPSGPTAQRPPQANGPGPSGPPAASSPQPGPGPAGPPGASGPPPGAQGPPGGRPPSGAAASPASKPSARSAQPSTPSRSTASSSSTASSAASRRPAADIELDDDDLKAAGGSTFSPMMLMLFGGLFLIGILFGWMASSAMKNREVYNARSEDATRIYEALKPKVENLEKAQKTINTLSPDKVDFEAAKKLADLDIAPDGNLLGGNRLLLGPTLIDNLTSYTVDANMLEQMLDEHKRITTQVDKEELEQLMKNNEVLEKDRFAVLFDYDHLAQKSGGENYVPKKGRLVTVSSLEKDDDGKIEVEMLNSDRKVKTKIQGILPLDKGDILKSGGQNALERYRIRVAQIQRLMKEFDKTKQPMMDQLEKLSSQDSAPLLNF